MQALAALSLQVGKDPAKVEAQVNHLLAAYPKEPLLLAIGADLAARQGRLDQALKMLDRAEVLQPNSLLIVRAKAGVRLQMGQVAQALAEARRALQIDPQDVSSRLLSAQAELANNEPQAALASVERVLAGQPKLVVAPPSGGRDPPPPGARRSRPSPTSKTLSPKSPTPSQPTFWRRISLSSSIMGRRPWKSSPPPSGGSPLSRCWANKKSPCSAAWDAPERPRNSPISWPVRNRRPICAWRWERLSWT